MQANLEMASWRILSGGRFLDWECAILQETNLLRRGAWVQTGYKPCPNKSFKDQPGARLIRTGAPKSTFVEACLDSVLV
jgi:hypothetical protein